MAGSCRYHRVLARDLFDFAIASGALTVLLGVMVGLRLNGALVPLLGRIQRAVVGALFSPVWLRRTILTL